MISLLTIGLGPIKLISPFKTLKTCGNSSKLENLRNFPILVILGSLIIFLVSANSFLKLENRTYKFLGKISYGIYMYHLIVIFIAIKSMIYFGYTNFSSLKANVVLYVFSIGHALTLVQ